MRAIDEVRARSAIDGVDRRMDHPPHQVVAQDVAIDRHQRLAGAQEAPVGGAELTIWSGVAFMAANDIDQPVVQQREKRGELRHDGMIVIARIGDQRLGEGDADARNAAVDPGEVLSRRPRDIAERAAAHRPVFFPAHSPEPQLGAAVIVRCIERVNVRRSDRTAAVQRLQPKRRAARVRGSSTETARDRKRDRRVHEIVCNELQQIGVAGGNKRIFPVVRRSSLVGVPLDGSIHSPRQAVHQSAEFCMVRRRSEGIDAEGAEALRWRRRAEEVTKAGHRRRLRRAAPIELGIPQGGCVSDVLQSHQEHSRAWSGRRDCGATREIIVSELIRTCEHLWTSFER